MNNFCVILSLTLSLAYFLFSYPFWLIFQECGYKTLPLLKNVLQKNSRCNLSQIKISIILFFCCAFFLLCVFFGVRNGFVYSAIALILLSVFYLVSESQEKTKLKLKPTKRFIRQITFSLVLSLVSQYFLSLLSNTVSAYFWVLQLLLTCPIFFIYLSRYLIAPLEALIIERYNAITKKRLKRFSGLKIAITGSYGKTSVKNILYHLLSGDKNVCMTPKSFNTPMGISLSVKGITKSTDVFIAEFGARKRGDIRKLAKIVKPDVCVLTGVNCQHLETFKSLDNIKNTKYEIFSYSESVKFGVFNEYDENVADLSKRFNGEKISVGDNKDVSVGKVKLGTEKTTFELTINKTKEEFETQLLGKHNVINIALSIGIALKLGIPLDSIKSRVKTLPFVSHRLQKTVTDFGGIILDDSYNSNVTGANCALEVLKLFGGKKIVITPGLVELGKRSYNENLLLGEKIGSVADEFVIVGKTNYQALYNGVKKEDKHKVTSYTSLDDVKEFLQKNFGSGDVVLFLNDLPDNYS